MTPSMSVSKLGRVRKSGVQHARSLFLQPNRKEILLLSGVQRSGTNMLLEVLDSSLQTVVFREGDPRAFDSYQLRDMAELQKLIDGAPARTVIFKALLEAGQLAALMQSLDARAIWVFRSYGDMINSYIRTWPGGRNKLDQIVAGEALDDWRAQGLSDSTLEAVRRLYSPDMSDADAIAVFWYYRNQMFFDQQLEDRADVIPVFYDDFVARPTAVSRVICNFAHIEFTPKLTRSVKTSSVGKNAAPALRPDIAEMCDDMMRRLEACYDAIFR